VGRGIPFPTIEPAVERLAAINKTAGDCSNSPGADGCPY
jgi:hypothetical protein